MWASLVLADALLVFYGHLADRPLPSFVMENACVVSNNSSSPTAIL
jgi:hypothetical protein